MTQSPYFIRVLRQFDIFVNVVFRGREYETISSRLGRMLEKGGRPVACVLCNFLDLFEDDHCLKSAARNRARLSCEAQI